MAIQLYTNFFGPAMSDIPMVVDIETERFR